MGTSAGVGFSVHRNPAVAGKEAAQKALAQAKVVKPDFVFVFATIGYNQQDLIRSIREATSGAPLSGCSGEGIITQETVAETNFGVTVMVISSDELVFHNACIKEIGQSAAGAGERLALEIRPLLTADTIAGFLFADGLVFDFDPFLDAFEKMLLPEHSFPVFGGLAADNWASKKTYQYHNDDVFSEGLSSVIMSGKGEILWGINHGCVPVGTKRTITRCQGNIIYEIDGIPALDAMKDYFDEDWKSEWNKTALNLCLGFKTPEHIKQEYGDYIIRYMVAKDDLDGSVTIQSDVCDGTDLWIVRRDKDLIRNGIQEISRRIKDAERGRRPKFVMQFECVGRGKVVFREQEKIDLIKLLQKDFGEDTPWIGFYSYGEIAPVMKHNSFHNFTAVVAAVY